MKDLHFTRLGRGELYTCDQGRYRFQVGKRGMIWKAWVFLKANIRAVADTTCASKAEAIEWCAQRYVRDEEEVG